jgi:hypothetical protein
VNKGVKMKVNKTKVKPVVVFGSATWAMTEMDMKRLDTRERKILRIFGLLVQQGISRIRTNQERCELYKDLDKIADIKRERLEWIGYVVRMDQGSAVKKVFESKLEGSRRRGRPRSR